MQTYQNTSQSNVLALQSRYPFPEIQFIRLIVWKECHTEIKPHGRNAVAGQIFQRFSLPFMPEVAVEFRTSGAVLSPRTTMAWSMTLSSEHKVDNPELDAIEEVISSQWVDPLAFRAGYRPRSSRQFERAPGAGRTVDRSLQKSQTYLSLFDRQRRQQDCKRNTFFSTD